MKKLFVLCLSIGSIITFAQAQATLIEKVEAKPGKLIVPYQKFQYPNGLTLIVSEDHSDPVTHLNVTYHVGSARETRGKSGFAHFFEHMLFQGSKHIADEEHFKIIKNYGGDVNGNTTRDRTVYIETFPSNFTETALWMEADRMGFFLEAFTNKKFEIQRSTVKNEKDERYDAPYGFLMEVKDQELYPKEHPYSWSTIGFVDDLDRADSNDLKNFFLRWYSPNNACVIVSGDVNTSEVVAWVDKYFGGIQRGPEVKKQAVPKVKLTENKVATYPDANAYVPLIYSTFVGVPVGHADEAALDVLTYLMGGTRSSTLYKKFVDAEWALQANASNNPLSSINHELAGEISFTVVGYPYSDVPRLQKMMKSAIDSFGIVGFSDEDLERAKTNILSNYSSGLEDVSTKANYLSSFWYLDAKNADGSSYNLEDDANRYRNLTKADIMRVYNMYLKNKFSS
ncbi:MAG: M16 family metallopeptidase, partial [Bacteroidia bacterium]